MTDDTSTCPCCGKSFSGESPERARNSALAHMTGSTDADHAGIGYQKATQLLEIDDQGESIDSQLSSESQPSSDSKLSTEAENQSSAEQSYSSDQSVADGGRQEIPDFDLEDQEDVDDDPDGCPKCGADGIPLQELEDDVGEDALEYLSAVGDRLCPGCSTSTTAEVF